MIHGAVGRTEETSVLSRAKLQSAWRRVFLMHCPSICPSLSSAIEKYFIGMSPGFLLSAFQIQGHALHLLLYLTVSLAVLNTSIAPGAVNRRREQLLSSHLAVTEITEITWHSRFTTGCLLLHLTAFYLHAKNESCDSQNAWKKTKSCQRKGRSFWTKTQTR